MAGLHAKLSPSAAHRWMNCPGSVRLIGDESSTSTMAAMKGTAAHKLLETMILADHHDVSEYAGYTVLVPGDDVEQKPDGSYHEAELYPPGTPALDPDKPRPGWFMFIVDEQMVNGVQVTIDEVDRLRSEMWNVKVYAERYIDMSWLDPRFGGTADVTLVEGEGDDDFLGIESNDGFEGWVDLVDHKNGVMLVDHKDNDQLLNYAVGLLHEHPKAKGVRVTISQPNAPHVEGPTRTAKYMRAEIDAFAKKMKKAALETDKPNAPLRAGDWCTFCQAKTRCEEFDNHVLAEARGEFTDADEVPDDLPVPETASALAEKARWVPLIDKWCKEIMTAIQRELEAGNEVPGWKLVRGRANRIWSVGLTPEMIIEKIKAEGFDIPEEKFWTVPELRSPAQIEKLGPKGRTKAIQAEKTRYLATLAGCWFKPDGKISVAEDTDPREAVGALHDANQEFSDDEDFGE